MKTIVGASGFGDAIYTRAITEHVISCTNDDITVQTSYPDVFYDLNVETTPIDRCIRGDFDLTYLHDKEKQTTTQFQDMLNRANLDNIELTSKLKKYNPLDNIVIIPPYYPMNGVKTSEPMKPYHNEFNEYIKHHDTILSIDNHCPFVKLVDIFNSAKLVISQVGWAVPLAEMLDVPINIIFTKRALNSTNKFISTITPNKICSKRTSKPIIMS